MKKGTERSSDWENGTDLGPKENKLLMHILHKENYKVLLKEWLSRFS